MDLIQKLDWRPEEVEGVDILCEIAAKYTDSKRAFVCFKYGTVVYSDTSSTRLDEEYRDTLINAAMQRDFSVREMEDANFLVKFQGPVIGLVVNEFYNDRIVEIHRGINAGGLLPGEGVIGGGESPATAEQYYVGLYARAKLYLDMDDPQIAFRFVP